MSLYGVHRLCADLRRNLALRTEIRSAPQIVLARYRLNPEEREAILAGDVAKLHRAGAHGYLLSSLGRYGVGGLTQDTYFERISRA
jgi:hypothetical protein